ncbi:hypothetical protein CFC21_108731 [Triticum aestivum]|uniref:BHLH domain-containing protein n=4 Tax=Triticinae TaxID=1648030 RepID=A0A3B6TPX8_WHEAT|nr:uncharacterized protein LOC109765626 [Aegilops tauschii subsp. strangulata]XP_044444107.1 uncharacterized protein LOC123170323 [Triticum aestivum]KAF7108213.1 hypothetical protein CFC21_108731 [Triticum aestivum]
MKRKGGDGGGTDMVFGMNDARTKASGRTEVEDLCSKLTSLLPQDYRLDASQGPPDIPSQLMQATAYIEDLYERVERLRQMRDDKTQRRSCRVPNTQGTARDVTVQLGGAAHFDVSFTTSPAERLEMHRVIRLIEQDGRMEVVEASWCFVDGGKVFCTIKCMAVSSEAVLDASMAATRLGRLLTDSLGGHGV